jgi:hypothetical protein
MHKIRKHIISENAKSELICIFKACNFDAGGTVLSKDFDKGIWHS